MFYKGKVALFWWHIYSNGIQRKSKSEKAKQLETVDFTNVQGIATVFLIMYKTKLES